MPRCVRYSAIAACILLSVYTAVAGGLGPGEAYTFEGDLSKSKDISGIAVRNDLLIVCSDEKCGINALRKTGDRSYKALPPIQLDQDEDTELDLEGAASDDDYVYLIGSHSLVRKGSDADEDYAENRKRLLSVAPKPSRHQLFRLQLDAQGTLISKNRISLDDILSHDQILEPFVGLPSKENGIDIEGIAIRNGKLFVGFRGPVLRDNYAPILVFDFNSPSNYELRFVDLAGRGIRDLTAINGGFLIIAGPVGDGDQSYQLYFWNGRDGVVGHGAPDAQTKLLGEIPTDGKAKAEGITVLHESENECKVLVVFDGIKNGGPREFIVENVWR